MDAYPRGTDHPAPSESDPSGTVRFDKVVEGKVGVSCSSNETYAYTTTTVVANDTVRVDLDATSMPSRPTVHRHAGLELESQLGEIMVKSVEKGGPAADLKTRVVAIEYMGTAAMARLEAENWRGTLYTDFFVLTATDGTWRIDSKVFFAHSRA